MRYAHLHTMHNGVVMALACSCLTESASLPSLPTCVCAPTLHGCIAMPVKKAIVKQEAPVCVAAHADDGLTPKEQMMMLKMTVLSNIVLNWTL